MRGPTALLATMSPHPRAQLGKFLLYGVVVISVFGLFSACSGNSSSSKDTGNTQGFYPVDPIFQEYLDYQGGTKRFGPAISPSRKEGYATTQFLESAKMIFDEAAPAANKFRFVPLGLEMAVAESPVPRPDDPNLPYLEGHTILPEFYLLYQQLGPKTVGKPLTEPRYNIIRRRYEQFFENLGFYRLEGSPDVHLLAYGAWACDGKCSPTRPESGAMIDIQSYIDPAFQDFVEKIGIDFTGFALANAATNPSGEWEQVLENVVLISDSPDDRDNIRLAALSKLVNMAVENPKPASQAPNMFFYAVAENLGYDIPLYFWEYIESHGGITFSGAPVTHYSNLMNGIDHQCFTNLCLMYDAAAVGGRRVRPEPIGYAYKFLNKADPGQTSGDPTLNQHPTAQATTRQDQTQTSQDEIVLRIRQGSPVLDQNEGQQIEVWVENNGEPIAGQVVELTVNPPNLPEQRFLMPATDQSGKSVFVLPPFEVMNGAIIPYKACLMVEAERSFCVAEIFVIWNNP